VNSSIIGAMKEDRAQRFKRIATYRTNEVLEKLGLLGNLSNKANYEYTEDELNKIFSAVEFQIRVIKAKFSSSKRKKEFSL
jgi:hypothetical protein